MNIGASVRAVSATDDAGTVRGKKGRAAGTGRWRGRKSAPTGRVPTHMRARHQHAWVVRTDVPREWWCKVCTGCLEVSWI